MIDVPVDNSIPSECMWRLLDDLIRAWRLFSSMIVSYYGPSPKFTIIINNMSFGLNFW